MRTKRTEILGEKFWNAETRIETMRRTNNGNVGWPNLPDWVA